MEPGACAAEGARVHGVNPNQVFKWQLAIDWGRLVESQLNTDSGFRSRCRTLASLPTMRKKGSIASRRGAIHILRSLKAFLLLREESLLIKT
jgi:hypothetical protein